MAPGTTVALSGSGYNLVHCGCCDKSFHAEVDDASGPTDDSYFVIYRNAFVCRLCSELCCAKCYIMDACAKCAAAIMFAEGV